MIWRENLGRPCKLSPLTTTTTTAFVTVSSLPTVAQRGRDAVPRRPKLPQLASMALIAVVGVPSASWAQNTGNPCVMIGQSCVISSTGGPAAPASGDGGNGGPGNPGASLSTTLIVPFDYKDDPSTSVPTSPINISSNGSAGASGNANTGGANFGQGGDGGLGGTGGDITLFVDSPSHGDDGTVISGSSGSVASGVTIASTGGTGGGGALGHENGGSPGTSATGGAGGAVNASIGGNFVSALGRGADIWSQGGTGGHGAAGTHDLNKFGVDGGRGGDGGPVGQANGGIRLYGYFQGQTTGVHVSSTGGNGGQGGDGDSDLSGQGGNGGTGGNGGPVSVTVEEGAQIVGYSGDGQSAGLWVQSLGGTGGHGGGGELGGTGGQGGDAGPVSVTLNGQVTAAGGNGAPAVLAQSLGSVGGSGGHASDWTFNPTGGAGNTGGLANTVTVNGTGARIQAGADTSGGNVSPGVLAQSIGGAGGIGADSTGIFAVGGSGGDGAAGSQVSINLTNSAIQSYGFGSAGLQAQSIGGGGGKGGDATSSGVHSGAAVNMVIGGTGGNGGAAADANVVNDGGSITTTNKHSPGLVIQSIGGGGGDGGAAYGVSYSTLYGAAISVGGSGGGAGSTVNSENITNNSGRILTIGSDSFGMLGQSIGGGGGNGGASTAKSIVKTPSGEGVNILSQSLSMASGGTGGNGGDADSVFLQNEGLIATQGAGAVGILAQAIGGGGGTGGDSSASSSASGGEWSLSASVSHGGSGGSGGHAGNVRGENHGLVITTGESADGMLVQSIGGGGGSGGSGDAKSSTGSDKSLSLTMAMGGRGGGGGEGYNVSANNTGTIITLGDGAHGMVEQTIGGGGGRGGGAAVSTSGKIVTSVAVGGTGGNGGDTFYNGSSSQATNAGTILTFGADATGILAQSIGGGGGDGGKAGTSLGSSKSTGDGGNGGANNAAGNKVAQVAADFASNGTSALGNYNSIDKALATANAMLGNDSLSTSDDDIADDLDDTSGSGGETEDDNKSESIEFHVGIGGTGGDGGAAGVITVNNTGTVATMGRHSDAIVVQAIGGGGGKGGAASTASSDDISGNVSVGGSGGGSNKANANNGGQPTVNNSGQIYTMGPLSNGIVAQSIAGGGGIGGSSTASSGGSSSGGSDDPSIALNISVGGGGGSGSFSEQSQVNSSGAIETRGHDSIGIVAQSISGGGGIVKTLATDLDNAGGSANASSTKDFAANIKIGNSSESTSGVSGAVFVQTQKGGAIMTMGDDSYGILAQSISGGGGVAQGGKPNGSSASDFFGSGKMTGTVNSGMDFDQNQGVQVEVGDAIQTSGAGAVGVFAQSIGGGGGISGDVGYTMQKVHMGRNGNHSGNGGDIQITVDQGASITTTASPCVTGRSCGNAPGIIAQSIGGGGGWFTNTSYAYIGSAGGTGSGGNVTLNIQGSIDARGPASPGIFAQSVGGSSNGGSGGPGTISITIGSANNTGVSVVGGNGFDDDAAAVRLDYGGLNTKDSLANTLVNWGTIDSHENDPGQGVYDGTAIYGQGGYTIVTNNGRINGLIHLGSQTGTNTFTWGEVVNNGVINSGSDISLGAGTLTNNGKLNIGGEGHVATTRLLGNFVQTATGRLVVDTNHSAGTSDLLDVRGNAHLGGTVEVQAASLANRAVTVLRATDGLTIDPGLDASRTYLYRFDTRQSGDTLQVQPAAEFSAIAGTLGRNQRRVAAHLQELWDSGATLDDGFTALAAVDDRGSYARTLNSLSGQTVGAIAAFRFNSSHGFVTNMLDECATFEGAGMTQDEASCTWARTFGGVADQDRTSDALGYHSSAWTLQAGGQREIAPGWFFGGSIGYESSSFRGDNGSSRISGDSMLLGAIIRYQTGPWQTSGALDFGYGWYDSKRSVEAGSFQATADASPNLWHVGAHARFAYQAPLDAWYVQPRLDLHLTYVHGNAYTENGASPFNLSVESEGAATFAAIPAVEVGGRILIGTAAVLRPFASAGIELNANGDWAARARFADQPESRGFRASTPIPDVLGKFSVGAELLSSTNWDFRLQYDSEVGDGYTSHAGLGRFAYRF